MKKGRIKQMPHIVKVLTMYCLQKVPIGSWMIKQAREEGPEYFNKRGEFDPFFQRRNWFARIINDIKRKLEDNAERKRYDAKMKREKEFFDEMGKFFNK